MGFSRKKWRELGIYIYIYLIYISIYIYIYIYLDIYIYQERYKNFCSCFPLRFLVIVIFFPEILVWKTKNDKVSYSISPWVITVTPRLKGFFFIFVFRYFCIAWSQLLTDKHWGMHWNFGLKHPITTSDYIQKKASECFQVPDSLLFLRCIQIKE